MKSLIIALVLMFSTPVFADEPIFALDHNRKAWDIASTVMVAGNIGADAIKSWKAEDKGKSFLRLGCRVGIAVGASEGTKFFVHRVRPNGVDDNSFFSEHTALAGATSGWRYEFGIPIMIGAGAGRIFSGYHYLSDVAVGAGVGLLTNKICGS